jgi:rSAM/selenodomain-associated transferase 2
MLTIVIPALNAAERLGACLDSVRDADEIVVVDGGSTDDTVRIATEKGARMFRSDRGRGVQLHGGALAASGDWLLFLHGDTVLPPGWRAAVDLHMTIAPQQAACFMFRLDATQWPARLIEAGVALRVRLLKLPYGDQGLLMSRRHYDEIGGYRPLPLMEDVDIVRRIGGARLRSLSIPALTSAERWLKYGWLRRSARNLSCLLLYGLGMPPARIASFYA